MSNSWRGERFERNLDDEAESIIFYLLDYVFDNCPNRFLSMLESAASGDGFSPFNEGMGVALYRDNDWPRNYQFASVYQADSDYDISVARLVEILILAMKVYRSMNQEAEEQLMDLEHRLIVLSYVEIDLNLG